MLCYGYTLTDFPISIRLTSLALWQSNDCPSAGKATLMNIDKYFMWIHYERLRNHNKAKHNKTVCIFLGIYCSVLKDINKFVINFELSDWYTDKYNRDMFMTQYSTMLKLSDRSSKFNILIRVIFYVWLFSSMTHSAAYCWFRYASSLNDKYFTIIIVPAIISEAHMQ